MCQNPVKPQPKGKLNKYPGSVCSARDDMHPYEEESTCRENLDRENLPVIALYFSAIIDQESPAYIRLIPGYI